MPLRPLCDDMQCDHVYHSQFALSLNDQRSAYAGQFLTEFNRRRASSKKPDARMIARTGSWEFDRTRFKSGYDL